MRSLLTGTFLALSVVLVACGGVTVEGNSNAESTTSLARETTTAPESATGETSTTSSSQSASSAQWTPQDQAAEEISELPETATQRSPEEAEFLAGLSAGGINIVGAEDQLIATASTVCRSQQDGVENFTLDAIAGQLITQGRTDVTEDRAVEVSTLIRETAERTYC